MSSKNCSAFSAYERIEGDRTKGLLIIADHARADLPSSYGTLGLGSDQLSRHIAYDIGVRSLTLKLAELLQVPAVLSTFSRLLIDPNRGSDDPTLVMRISDGALIPGNARIADNEIEARKRSFYLPYHQAVADELTAIEDVIDGEAAVILSIHSFTPVWRGEKRLWEVAILWDSDPRFAVPLIDGLKSDKSLTVGDNEPYDGALLNDCMYQHGTSKGRAHALVEMRQDLIGDDAGATLWANKLSDAVRPLLSNKSLYEETYYPSRALEKVTKLKVK